MQSSGETQASRSKYDVVIVGGGHNGLTAAAYLARAGKRVLVLERLDHVGGAAVSAEAFPGTGVRLSRYSYLVSVMPAQLIEELSLDLELRSRRTASYTPVQRDGHWLGLLAERPEGPATGESFRRVTGGDASYAAWQAFYDQMQRFAEVVAPTFMGPLPRAGDLRQRLDADLWNGLVQRPLGELLEQRFSDDLVRGVVATDALIGTFASLSDPSLVQNRCFLYHLVGNGTGEWRVPTGGMGAVTDALARAASAAGAEIVTGAGASRISPGPDGAQVDWHDGSRSRTVMADWVLSNVSAWVLDILLGGEPDTASKPVGSQLKINFLLDRLPRLKSGDDSEQAFAGTFHVAEGYADLETAFGEASAGRIPKRVPGEFYCHSLTDPSILGPLAGTGAQTLTYFGVHLPTPLFDQPGMKEEAVAAAIATIDECLAEPLMNCVRRSPDGQPCIEAKVPQDIERDLAMPGGHIFHGDLTWPWANDREALDSPGQRWGVATEHERVLVCGSSARRGGAVSGLGGHNAAMAVLET